MLAELRRQAAGESFDLLARPGVVLADLNRTRLKDAFEGHDVPIRAAKLEALGVLTNYQGKVVATNAGVILFGQDALRRRWFRDARVEGARFAGGSRTADIEDLFDPEEELTVLEAVDAVERFIRRNTRQAEPIPKGRLQREPLPEYSSVMIRELLVNAVAHTDYSKSGETIKAFVYDDRVEIHNPGADAAGHHHGRYSRGSLKDPQPRHRRRAAAHTLHGALRYCLGKDQTGGGPRLSRAAARRGWARVHSDDLAAPLVRRRQQGPPTRSDGTAIAQEPGEGHRRLPSRASARAGR